MSGMKFKVVESCINQDTGKRLSPDDVVDNMSDFERGRHLAEGNIIPFTEGKRKRSPRKRKNVSN